MGFATGVSVALVLFLAGAGSLLAQVQAPQDRINTALARARQAGISASLLESKIAEGKAKGVSMDRIATAVERRETALERASQAMAGQPGTSAADLAVAADAIDSGVSEAVLKVITETAPREHRTVAIAALTQLVQLGHTPEAALERVRDALARGAEALLNLPAETAGRGRDASTGARPPNTGRGRGGSQGAPPASMPSPGGTTKPRKPDTNPSTDRPTNQGGRATGPGTGGV